MIKNGRLWFCNLGDLNDPFEGDYAVEDKELVDISKLSKFSQDGNDLLSRVARYVDIDREDLRRQFYVLSLSSIQDDILMWSHYAGQHQGIVIEYDMPEHILDLSKDSDFNFIENSYGKIIHNVDYSGHPVFYSLSTERENEYGRVITKKTPQWSYEREYRMLIHEPNVRKPGILINSNPGIIKAVYFGMRVSRYEMDKFISSVDRSDIKYHKMIIRHGHFELTTIEA